MTENEAKLLEKLDELANDTEVDMYSVANLNFFFEESANTIRKLFEEIQQYRAIGTVEEIKAAMKYMQIAKMHGTVGKVIDACAEYEAIGTIEEFKALKEKSVAKKGIPYTSSNNHKFVECPSCHKDMDLYYDFCQYCGQAVDWGKSKT